MSKTLFSKRQGLFPVATEVRGETLFISGLSLYGLAQEFGTPLYIYDQATLDRNLQDYRAALSAAYPGKSGVTYAGKAFLCLAIAQWAREQDLWLDCTGAGELSIAQAAGIKRDNVLVHGVNKSQADLQAAVAVARTIVVDHLAELEKLSMMKRSGSHPFPQIWLRLRPGLAVETHSYTQTGQSDSKFGMSPDEIEGAVQLCRAANMELSGLHFHQGSHFHDPVPLELAIETALDLLVKLNRQTGWFPKTFCPGGGWGVPYHEDDLPHPPVSDYIDLVGRVLAQGCQRRGFPLPDLQLEPGRSLVARAGVAVYQVETVKHTAQRRWLLLDGGLADNPRPALYGARYTCLPVSTPERAIEGPAWLAGPFCESGDILIERLPMPAVQAGEYIAVPVSGAYQLSMGSNYNGARRPAVVWLNQGRSTLIQRRETLDDLIRRDLPLPVLHSGDAQ